MRDDIIATYEHNNTRVSVVRDDCPIHPWVANDMASNLAFWDEDDSYLPWTGNNKAQQRLDTNYQFIESHDDMQAWIDDAKNTHRPFMVFGLTHFDKYGGLVLHTNNNKGVHQNDLENFDGAIFIDEKRFRKYVDSQTQMSDETMTGLMVNVLMGEFESLNCYASGACYGVVVEQRCPLCNQWEQKDSVYGFECLSRQDSPEWKAMLKQMIDGIDTDTMPQAIKQMLS
jgi:hypothetical protein